MNSAAKAQKDTQAAINRMEKEIASLERKQAKASGAESAKIARDIAHYHSVIAQSQRAIASLGRR